MSDNLTYFAKVENGIVTDVRVVDWDFIVANPERYGDPSAWIQVFKDNSGRGYASVGWYYDEEHDKMLHPVPNPFTGKLCKPVYDAVNDVFIAPTQE